MKGVLQVSKEQVIEVEHYCDEHRITRRQRIEERGTDTDTKRAVTLAIFKVVLMDKWLAIDQYVLKKWQNISIFALKKWHNILYLYDITQVRLFH